MLGRNLDDYKPDVNWIAAGWKPDNSNQKSEQGANERRRDPQFLLIITLLGSVCSICTCLVDFHLPKLQRLFSPPVIVAADTPTVSIPAKQVARSSSRVFVQNVFATDEEAAAGAPAAQYIDREYIRQNRTYLDRTFVCDIRDVPYFFFNEENEICAKCIPDAFSREMPLDYEGWIPGNIVHGNSAGSIYREVDLEEGMAYFRLEYVLRDLFVIGDSNPPKGDDSSSIFDFSKDVMLASSNSGQHHAQENAKLERSNGARLNSPFEWFLAILLLPST